MRVPLAVDEDDDVVVSVEVETAVRDADGEVVAAEDDVDAGDASGLRDVDAEEEEDPVVVGETVRAEVPVFVAVDAGDEDGVAATQTAATALTSFTDPATASTFCFDPPIGVLGE